MCTALLLRHFPYLWSAHHSTSFWPSYLSLSTHFHVVITISSSVFLSKWPNHHSLASLIFSLMFTTPALTFKIHDTNLIYPDIIGQQASGFEVRVSTNRYFHVAIGEMRLVTINSTLKNQHMVEVTVRTAPKATSVINCGSAIMCVVHWPRNSAIRLTLSRLL